ncbi:MAG TPA: response regulator [Cytophagales bacterium]|nr:response regulator [Cytophagales bacterium]
MSKFNKVIIVDDEPTSLFICRKTLELSDLFTDIQTFESPVEALAYLNHIYLNNVVEEIPSLILVDINMPIMNGWEFIEEFKKLPEDKTKNTVINILSSSDSEQDIKKAAGIDKITDYISKPLTVEKTKTFPSYLIFNKYSF